MRCLDKYRAWDKMAEGFVVMYGIAWREECGSKIKPEGVCTV